MNKVTCNLCGTSYPENAAQCPICGEVRSADSLSERSSSGTYVYAAAGNVIRRAAVTLLWSDGEEALVSGETLHHGSEVLVGGRNLYDGKPY